MQEDHDLSSDGDEREDTGGNSMGTTGHYERDGGTEIEDESDETED